MRCTRSSLDVDSEFEALLETDALVAWRLTMLWVVATDTDASRHPITIFVNFESRSGPRGSRTGRDRARQAASTSSASLENVWRWARASAVDAGTQVPSPAVASSHWLMYCFSSGKELQTSISRSPASRLWRSITFFVTNWSWPMGVGWPAFAAWFSVDRLDVFLEESIGVVRWLSILQVWKRRKQLGEIVSVWCVMW